MILLAALCVLVMLCFWYLLDISEDVISAEEQERMESNKKELDRYLGAYPYERLVHYYIK